MLGVFLGEKRFLRTGSVGSVQTSVDEIFMGVCSVRDGEKLDVRVRDVLA